jgi:hypothetical protein
MNAHIISDGIEDIVFLTNEREEVLMIICFYKGRHYIGSWRKNKVFDEDKMRLRWELANIIENNVDKSKSG